MKHAAILTLLALTACDLTPDFALPTAPVPEGWANAPASAPLADIRDDQWEDFGSEELNRLIAAALAHNTDLAAALARIEQARSAVTISGSGRYPDIGASGSISQDRTSGGSFSGSDRSARAGLSLAYELDLWQRNANLAESALWSLRATQFDRDALALLVTSEVARFYSGTLALAERVAVSERNLANFREVLRITQARFDEGAISRLELSQQSAVVANAEAGIASLRNQHDLFRNQLAVLTGVPPVQLQLLDATLDSLTVPDITLTEPWTLLARRPDIARAEASLRAANIDIGVARANALPGISIGLDTAITASPASTATGLVASFFAPIFQGGALQADIERARARRSELEAAYEGTLLTAFREVEDALSTFDAARTRLAAFTTAAEESRRASLITGEQYNAGAVDFQALLDTQRTLLQAEDAQVAARQELLAAAIDLFRALGGEASP